MSDSSVGNLGKQSGMAELLSHVGCVCKWYLGNLSRPKVLFNHALCLTDSGEDGFKLCLFILYSIARLEYYCCKYQLAQQCIGLCLKENLMPRGNSKVWELWADVSSALGNDEMVRQCKEQAAIVKKEEREEGLSFV